MRRAPLDRVVDRAYVDLFRSSVNGFPLRGTGIGIGPGVGPLPREP